MTAQISDFIKCPKIDTHNHLNLGMRYASYAPWAGFYIPNFPRKLNGLEDMHENIIVEYTRPRCKTSKDVQDLLTLSIQDAIIDNVKILEGSVDIGFIHKCGSVENFLTLVTNIKSKFEGKINFRPELGLGKTFNFTKIQQWSPLLIESGLFKSIDLYGPEVDDNIENFKSIYELAGKNGLKKKAHIGEFSDAKSVKNLIEILELDEVQHGIGAAQDKEVLSFLRDNKIKLNICPESNIMLGAVPSYKEHPIRKIIDAGVSVTIGTDDLLMFNKSISEQCVELVNAGLFTIEEIKLFLNKTLEDLEKEIQ
ncbi:MAG: adenosine deaminase [Treponema sp.]|nr:adenosine deaminase [Treponema sp.]